MKRINFCLGLVNIHPTLEHPFYDGAFIQCSIPIVLRAASLLGDVLRPYHNNYPSILLTFGLQFGRKRSLPLYPGIVRVYVCASWLLFYCVIAITTPEKPIDSKAQSNGLSC